MNRTIAVLYYTRIESLEHGAIRYPDHTSRRLPALRSRHCAPCGVKSLNLRHHEIPLGQSIHKSASHDNTTVETPTLPKYPPAPPHRAAIPSLVAARLHGASTRSAISVGPSRATNREKMQHEMNIQRRGERGRTAEPLTDCRPRGGSAATAVRCFEWLGRRRRRSAAGCDSYRRNPSKRGGFEGGERASAGRGMGEKL